MIAFFLQRLAIDGDAAFGALSRQGRPDPRGGILLARYRKPPRADISKRASLLAGSRHERFVYSTCYILIQLVYKLKRAFERQKG